MKIAILSYPMLFQNHGGLQVQVLETISALNELGIEAKLINPNQENLTDYDIVHVFSAINGNHRIVEQAKAIGKPVVTSPLIQDHWNHSLGKRARFLESLVGRLTSWNVKTEYQQIHSCLDKSDRLITLGNLEKTSIIDAFKISADKIHTIPNGIPKRFFKADEAFFIEKTGIKPGFILCVGSINPYKNQSKLAEATKELNVPLVLIGPCLPADKLYLDSLQKYKHVHYIGALKYEDPLLNSAYAAAGVFCIASMSEVMPLCVLESLAAGTPAVMTKHHGMNLEGLRHIICEIAPLDSHEIRLELENWLATPPAPKICKDAVRELTWSNVAAEIKDIYIDLLNTKEQK